MATADEVTTEEVPTGRDSEPEGWEEAVWRAYCKGNRRIGPLRRVSEAVGGPGKWETIDRFIKRMKKDLTIDRDVAEDRADYEAGVEADLEDADAVYNKAMSEDNLNAAVGAIGKRLEAREKLAASRFVVTQRKGLDHSGKVAVEQVGLTPEALAQADALAQKVEDTRRVNGHGGGDKADSDG